MYNHPDSRLHNSDTLKTEGVKFDEGKPRWDLVPWDALEEIVKVLTFGSIKYEDRNWEKGMAWGRLIRAAFSHLGKWAMRDNTDPESGLSHLAHAGCCILFLLAYSIRNVGVDNRPNVVKEEDIFDTNNVKFKVTISSEK